MEQQPPENPPTASPSPLTPPPPPRPTAVVPMAYPYQPPTPPRRGWQRFVRIMLILSILLNVYLILMIAASGLVGRHNLRTVEYLPGDDSHKIIALIHLSESIDMVTAEDMREQLAQAAEDEDVKGVILVVNSPGGQVVPSEMINRYIKTFRNETNKPLYACIEQLGASGAYWIACAAEKIYAQENSLVGSIGVIYLNLVIEQTLKDKLGVNPIIVKSSRAPFKDHNTPFRMPTEAEITDIREDLDTIHQRFVRVVRDSRGLSDDAAWNIANGDVYDGSEAYENKLIDDIAFLDEVIDDLAGELGITNPTVVRYARPPSLGELLFSGKAALDENPLDLKAQLEKLAATPRIQALWLGS
ncbi:MAG: signal peptide peptidase SppA [Sedimentisphaerales bacterium]|nr:signal peptide peptidase SppA [Sedimentisphaerales bacterium]